MATEPLRLAIAGSRNSSNISSIYRSLRPLIEADEPRHVVVDLSDLQFLAPCAIAALSIGLQHAMEVGKLRSGSIIPPTRAGVAHYLHVMDFYALLGIEPPGTHARPAHHGFMPAAHVPARPSEDAGGRVARKLVDAVGDSCDIEPKADSTLWSSLSEVIDNVEQHAESTVGCVAVAASWHRSQQIELAVADAGIGIPAALRANPVLVGLRTDEDAMRAAIQRFVSGLEAPGRGQGLWQVSEILRRNEGVLTLLSSEVRLTVRSSGAATAASQKVLGTLAIMRFKMDIPVHLADIVREDQNTPLDEFVEFDPWSLDQEG